MKKTNLIRFVQSLVLLPMSMQLSMANVNSTQITPSLLVSKVNIEINGKVALNQAADLEAQILKAKQAKADAIDAYFAEHDMPLEGAGMKMVTEAENNDLDWRLLAAISVRESTGGKNDCIKVNHNAFGWGSCKIGFKTDDQAIETVARNLGGNNPKTSMHYDNKTTKEILRAYNPPSIVPKYAEQVMSIMDTIGPVDAVTVIPVSNT
jgi:hypothetical protein